jgi:hypothetical protein
VAARLVTISFALARGGLVLAEAVSLRVRRLLGAA